MEFRKMVTTTLCTRQQKRHWCIEQSFGLCGRGRGWDDLGEWHWNMYNIMYETSRQSRFNARYGCLGLVHWDDPEGWYGEEGGFSMRNTCIPVEDSFWYMAKPIQYCKVKKKKMKTSSFPKSLLTFLAYSNKMNMTFSKVKIFSMYTLIALELDFTN